MHADPLRFRPLPSAHFSDVLLQPFAALQWWIVQVCTVRSQTSTMPQAYIYIAHAQQHVTPGHDVEEPNQTQHPVSDIDGCDLKKYCIGRDDIGALNEHLRPVRRRRRLRNEYIAMQAVRSSRQRSIRRPYQMLWVDLFNESRPEQSSQQTALPA